MNTHFDPFGYLVPAIFLMIAGAFLFRFIRYGSLTGAFLGAHVKRTVGEIALSKIGLTSRVIKVQILDAKIGEKPCVAVSLISKAPFGASMAPLKLTATQATDLANLLQQASSGRAA